MLIVKALAKSLVLAAVLYAGFRYFGDFSRNQSTVLTAVAWMGYGLYENLSLSRKTEDIFAPFCVTLFPNWYQLLSDFKLIRDEEDWKRLCEASEKIPTSKYNVLRSGFWFTVIKPPQSNGLLPGLTFWNNEKVFLNELELNVPVIEAEESGLSFRFGEKHKFFDHPSWSSLPRIVFKWGSGGYEIGLKVQYDWWKERCASGELKELANVKEDRDHLCGTTRLLIATLPYSEFAAYYQNVDYAAQQKQQEAWDKQLAAHGWQRKDDDDSEIRDPWSHVEHKYFSVSHRRI